MKKVICSTLTATIVPLTVLSTEINFSKPVTAKSAIQRPATKQVRDCTPRTCTSYRISYERAIAKGIINEPSWVANEEEAIQLGYQAIEQGDRYEAAIRFAQALVLISENYNLNKALEFEQYLDSKFQEEKGQTLREFLPMFGRIFPQNSAPTQTRNNYRINYERAIASGLIDRPSPVTDEQQAVELAYQALDRGDRYEAAIRFAQALVIISEQQNQTLREFFPLFGRIFPLNSSLSP